MRIATLAVTWICTGAGMLAAQDWQALTAELVKKEKPGFGGVSGVVVDRTSGDVFINVSDRGLFRSTDQGKTWQRHGNVVKGRTETPGCMQIDPTGARQRILMPTVYGGPIAVGSTTSEDCRFMSPKANHVDWCAVDWNDPELKFVLTLKHEAAGLLLLSRDGGKSFSEVGKGYGPAFVFDADTAVVALEKRKDQPKGGIVRTTDGGKSFQPAAEYTAVALPRWHGGALYWLASGALVKTTDRGATWTKICDLKDARFGPVFGKSDKQMFVLTGSGVIDTIDAGQTWSKPIPPPKEMKGVSGLAWLDYDPRNDMLYLMKMGSDLFKLARAP